jgi:hypothetical protein
LYISTVGQYPYMSRQAATKTGLVFWSVLETPKMMKRLERKFPEIAWQLHDSDLYRYYYMMGKRYDEVIVKIMPEDNSDEYYLGVYFSDMPKFQAPRGAHNRKADPRGDAPRGRGSHSVLESFSRFCTHEHPDPRDSSSYQSGL